MSNPLTGSAPGFAPEPRSRPTLSRLSEEQAAKYGTRTALVFADVEYTYGEVHRRVLDRAAALRAAGIDKGDRVAYLGPNHPALVELLLACLRIGAIFIPLNWRLAAAELDYQLGNAGVSLLVVAPETADLAAKITAGTPQEALVWDAEAVLTPATTGTPGATGQTAAQAAPAGSHAARVNADDPAFLLFTSGTTGHPKGAVLNHGNIIWNAFNLILDADISARDITLASAPLFHVAALDQQVMTTYIRGGKTVFLPKWQADAVFDNVEKYRVTWLFGVTTMFADLVHSPRWDSADLSSLRFVNSGGAPIPVALIRDYLDRDVAFCQAYGLTETAPGATFLTADDAIRKPGSAGLAVPFAEVRVVDPERTALPAGERGEIEVRGPNVIRYYWDNEAATRASFSSDGWFHTGDVGYLDSDGYLFIVDRLKDMYISGGENVYPAEVESVLFEHPAIDEVAVVADPDQRWGEVGHAFIVPHAGTSPDPDEIIAYAAARLAKYKVPKTVTVVSELPRTGSGKVHKVALRGSGPLGAHANP